MGKGIFTASACVLLSAPVTLDAVRKALTVKPTRKFPAQAKQNWLAGWPALLLPMGAEGNGSVLVEVISLPWPDAFGDPADDADMLYGAWSMGWFGPFVHAGGLDRAIGQCSAWPEAREQVGAHTSFIRIKATYALGKGDESAIVPASTDSVGELRFITSIALDLLGLPQSICYFNPNGETLLRDGELVNIISQNDINDTLPTDVWRKVRGFCFDEDAPWMVIDTIGMEQFDTLDHEACFDRERVDASAVGDFLRSATDAARQSGQGVADGCTMDGAGTRWRAKGYGRSLLPRPRPVIRWMPEDATSPPARFVPTSTGEDG